MNNTNQNMGKFLILLGILTVLAGVIITNSGNIPFLGKLPGDIRIRKENFSFYFPISTSLLLSILLSFIFYLIYKFK